MSEVFTKHNPLPGSRSLECEHLGLEELRRFQPQHGLNIPSVIELRPDQLVLERIESRSPSTSDWIVLGQGLAKLHQVYGEIFGFEEDNFIGLNPQMNSPCSDWGQFFYDRRLLYQVKLIRDVNVRDQFLAILEERNKSLIDFLNAHNPHPSLLHGDLWSGNVMFNSSGPWLIDPAVYYGDCECDLAMTKMFGGFSAGFYEAYFSLRPLPTGYQDRFVIYNLYHYLNHYNIFGSSYLPSVRSGFRHILKLA